MSITDYCAKGQITRRTRPRSAKTNRRRFSPSSAAFVNTTSQVFKKNEPKSAFYPPKLSTYPHKALREFVDSMSAHSKRLRKIAQNVKKMHLQKKPSRATWKSGARYPQMWTSMVDNSPKVNVPFPCVHMCIGGRTVGDTISARAHVRLKSFFITASGENIKIKHRELEDQASAQRVFVGAQTLRPLPQNSCNCHTARVPSDFAVGAF